MGKKIFISYKYADSEVEALPGHYFGTTVRDYVDLLETYFDRYSDHIYKGESDNEDLSYLNDDQIWEKLKDRIYDSSLTIVMISPNMRESWKSDRSQWIPWEIAFSLRETTRQDRTSHCNAMLAVVLPDRNGSYDYYLTRKSCGSTTHNTNFLFGILRRNKFNIKNPDIRYCSECGGQHYYGSCSYIEAVKWCDFKNDVNRYINAAVARKEHKENYDICKEV